MNKLEKIDIKKTKIPNVCFSLTEFNDKREKKLKKQRQIRGFDDSETWSLDYTIVRFIIPRMKRFIKLYSKNIKHTPKTIKNFKTFLKAMELKKKGIEDVLTDDELKIMQEGLELFPKIIHQLWW